MKSLNKKWKEFVFAFSGFGPNFLMILMGSYYSDALNPASLETGEQFQAIMPGVCFILPALFPILFAVGKIFDGIIDIPFAHITDTLSTKWGRRRPAIAVCFLPMLISYILCWIPVGGPDAKLFNTIWVTVMSMIFFAAYTMCLIAYYGSFSAVCEDEPQRLRVSGYKSFFDTITYCLVYALVPVILSGARMQINTLVFITLPLMLTMLIPLFLIKEGEKYGYPENDGLSEEKLTLKESLHLTFKNRIFRRWLYVNCCTFFGLQMFLSAMNGLIIGGMGLNGLQMAILNTCAFGPVPVMLYMFNKAKARYGIRAVYQSCLLLFAVAILSFFLGSRFIWGDGNLTVKMTIGILGGLCGSWSIGAFFMMPYLAPAQISGVEEKLTGKNHSAMYFAGNAVTTSIVGAISGNLVYEYLKNIFLAKDHGLVWAEATGALSAPEVAYSHFFGQAGTAEEVSATVFNFGNLMVPFIVLITCVLGYFLAFKLPRDFKSSVLARELKELDPSLDISAFETDEEKPERSEIIFVQIGLSILSGFLFGFIWVGMLLRNIKNYCKQFPSVAAFLLSCFVPFVQIAYLLRARKALLAVAEEKGVAVKMPVWALVLPSLVFPVLFTNVIALSVLQNGLNRIYAFEDQSL
ncbi:MAG: MFS transporter [Clostridia bacterium]|nr:MFS transporter [Clostridia bacterium]